MADYAVQIEDLKAAAAICEQHTMPNPEGVHLTYPRWPNAWAACEIVWRNYLDMQTMLGDNAEDDRQTVIDEARTLR